MGDVVALVNQKGGVGKTATTLGLTNAAIERALSVLVVDLDPQGNASYALGIDDPPLTVYDVLHSRARGAAATAICDSTWPGVAVLPADQALSHLEASATAPEALAIALVPVVGDFDLVLVDCPPAVGRLTLNGLTAAAMAIVVTTPAAFAIAGVMKVLDSIATVQEHYNPSLRMVGIIVNEMPPRGREANLRLGELRTGLEADLWEPVVPRRAVVDEAVGARRPLRDYGHDAAAVTGPYAAHLAHLLSAARPRRRR